MAKTTSEPQHKKKALGDGTPESPRNASREKRRSIAVIFDSLTAVPLESS
jgi:hypothetical protein